MVELLGKYLILLQSTVVKQVKLRRYFMFPSLEEIIIPVFVRTSFIFLPRVTYHYKPVATKRQPKVLVSTISVVRDWVRKCAITKVTLL